MPTQLPDPLSPPGSIFVPLRTRLGWRLLLFFALVGSADSPALGCHTGQQLKRSREPLLPTLCYNTRWPLRLPLLVVSRGLELGLVPTRIRFSSPLATAARSFVSIGGVASRSALALSSVRATPPYLASGRKKSFRCGRSRSWLGSLPASNILSSRPVSSALEMVSWPSTRVWAQWRVLLRPPRAVCPAPCPPPVAGGRLLCELAPVSAALSDPYGHGPRDPSGSRFVTEYWKELRVSPGSII